MDSENASASKPNIPKAVLPLFVLLTVLVVVLKIGFVYYNLLFPVVAICAVAIILKRYKAPRGQRIIFWVILCTCFMCLIFPDRVVYKLRKSHHYFWSEAPLGPSHFKIRRNIESDTVAIVNPTITGEISKVYNYPPAIIFTSDYIGRSWIDALQFKDSEEDKKLLIQLLEHEKRHFDIMEIYVRRAQDSLNKMIFSNYRKKYETVEYYFKISDSIQDIFDAETNNGTIEEEIEKWNKKIIEQLNQKNS